MKRPSRERNSVCSFCGTEAYLAPEMILRLPYGASVDFWQYGCFVYELYAGRSPFWLPRKPRKFIRENILNGVFAYPSVVPEPAKGITGALLQVSHTVCWARTTYHINPSPVDIEFFLRRECAYTTSSICLDHSHSLSSTAEILARVFIKTRKLALWA